MSTLLRLGDVDEAAAVFSSHYPKWVIGFTMRCLALGSLPFKR